MRKITMAVMIAILAAVPALADSSAAQKTFDQIKALAGTWEGKNTQGQPVKVSFRVTANGSAVMSEIMGDEDMITMFNMDGDRLLMTHYCIAGNQPRMVAASSQDGKSISFEFLDATNLEGPSAGHMHHVVFTMPDADHHTEEWIFMQGGKSTKENFDLQRVK
ncbi:MAG TPA: hypothetical protein VGG46_15970 [Terriglobales bacterium]|jgi:hypothetical protein